MEQDQQQISLDSLPLYVWKNVITSYHEDYTKNKHDRGYRKLLKPIFRCKIASKKLNLLLDDEFFFQLLTTPGWRRNYRKYFLRVRMESLIKLGDFYLLQRHLSLMAEKYKMSGGYDNNLRKIMPFVIRNTTSESVTEFLQMDPNLCFSDTNVFFDSVRYAYLRQDESLLVVLLWDLPGRVFTSGSFLISENLRQTVEGLGEGKKLNLDKCHDLMDFLTTEFDEDEQKEKLQQIFSPRVPREVPVIVPEGELITVEKLKQNKAFKRGRASFCVRPSKKGNHVTLMYRDVNGSQHSIPIATTTDQSGAITQFSFGSESRATLSSLIFHRSLSSLIFADYPHQLIAVTRELLALPYEQQPWFRGLMSDRQCFTLASTAAPSDLIFFTYSQGNEVHLQFTESTANVETRDPYYFSQRITLHGEDISKYFPRNKLVLGLHNGGEINGLAEHLLRRAVQEGDLNKVKQVISEYNLDLTKTGRYDNVLETYVASIKKGTVANNDMILWLIENGAPLPRESDHNSLLRQVIGKCDDRVIQCLVNEGQRCRQFFMDQLFEQGCSYETLKVCWNSYRSIIRTATLRPFFCGLDNKKFKSATFIVKPLIMTAWKFDQNCHFRQLPKEIMLEILSYDGIDEPPYWDFLDFVFKGINPDRPLDVADWTRADLLRTLPLIWKNWDSPSYSAIKSGFVAALFDVEYIDHFVLEWSLKLLQRITDLVLPKSRWRPLVLLKYCLCTPNNDMALSIIKLLLEKKIVNPSHFIHNENFMIGSSAHYVLPHHMAILSDNIPVIELLIDHGIMFHTYAYALTLDNIFAQFPEKEHLRVHINNYRDKIAADKSNICN